MNLSHDPRILRVYARGSRSRAHAAFRILFARRTPSMPSSPTFRAPWMAMLGLAGLGLALRLAFLLLAGDTELQSDEANYVYLALGLERFGVYLDNYRYLWPPGYPWYLSRFLADGADASALFYARLGQVLVTPVIGVTTMLFAWRIFGARAARLAGLAWAFYLPLIGFSHLLWNETLFLACFLPALYQLLCVLQAGPDAPADRRLVVAGVLFAAALYMKEAAIFLAPLLALLVGREALARGWLEGARRASLFLCAVAAPILPWTLRNAEVYGAFVPLGTSLGENAYNGLNETYANFDLRAVENERLRQGEDGALEGRIGSGPPGSGWERAEELTHLPTRLAENTARGLAYARAHPSYFCASRIKKLADFVLPVSFFTRHLTLGNYDGGALPAARKPLTIWALACPVLALTLGLGGFVLALRDRAGLLLIGTVFLYFGGTSLLVAMSRFRLPLVPFLLVLGAGLLAGGVRRRRAWPLALLVWAALLGLWWLDLPELRELAALSFRGLE
jgi:4-amino-4-deoxy-L-arabinose transferase-like glycosyltransferase